MSPLPVSIEVWCEATSLPTTGLWCDACLLPSGLGVDITTGSGMKILREYRAFFCPDCGTFREIDRGEQCQ